MSLYNMTPNGVEQQPTPEFVALDPDDANRLGQQHYLAGDFARAEECWLAVVKADPKHAFAWGNLGLIWMHTGYYDDALQCMMLSKELNPDNAVNITNLGYVHDMLGYPEHAIALYKRALEMSPGDARTQANLAHAYLHRFEFAKGWALMDGRFNTVPKMSVMREYPFPLWDGQPCRKLAIWREQGIGDQIAYATMLPDLIARGQDFVCELDERLLPAFRRSFPQSDFVGKGHAGVGFEGCDAHIPLMSLAQFFRPDAESFIAQPKRLLRADWRVDTGMPEHWKRRIAISWRSFHPPINIGQERRKSTTLSVFAPLALRDDLELITVQYGDVKGEIEDFRLANPLTVPALDLFNDIDGILALISTCDAVVTTSNVTAHFAGALGVPCYLMYLRGIAPFYYHRPGPDGRSLWYPSVRIVSGEDVVNWEEAVGKVNVMLSH